MGLSQISQETVSRKGTKREPETQRQHLEHNKDLLAEAHSLIFPEKAHANPPFLERSQRVRIHTAVQHVYLAGNLHERALNARLPLRHTFLQSQQGLLIG